MRQRLAETDDKLSALHREISEAVQDVLQRLEGSKGSEAALVPRARCMAAALRRWLHPLPNLVSPWSLHMLSQHRVPNCAAALLGGTGRQMSAGVSRARLFALHRDRLAVCCCACACLCKHTFIGRPEHARRPALQHCCSRCPDSGNSTMQKPPAHMPRWWGLPKNRPSQAQRTLGAAWQDRLDALDGATLLGHLRALLQPGAPCPHAVP